MKIQTILALALIATCCNFTRAQVQVEVEGGVERIQYPLLPEGVIFEDLDEPTREKYLKLVDKYFQYQISAYQHREKVFAWQHFSSQIIFVVVFILVGVGIYFSWLQFRQSLESSRTKAAKQAHQSEKVAKEPDDIEVKEMKATQLKISTKEIEVSSSVLGVIILVISLLFFYLYLVHVYPISEIQ